MIERPLACPRCSTSLPGSTQELERADRCPQCRGRLEVEIFPALFRKVQTGVAPALMLDEEDASCFYHSQKKAVLPCDVCGRFLCALCDVELDGKHVCPGCLDAEKKKGRLPTLDNHRVLYDTMALGFALIPILFWPLTLLTAPAAIYVSIRHWKSPGSIIPRTKVRYVIAIVVALIQVAGWGILAWAMLRNDNAGR